MESPRSAERREVPIRLVQEKSIRSAGAVFGCSMKAEIAATVAVIYPELLGSVPPP
jgi:hypothetical protein